MMSRVRDRAVSTMEGNAYSGLPRSPAEGSTPAIVTSPAKSRESPSRTAVPAPPVLGDAADS